ncbi:MAG: transglutaminase domain-containing protein [Phycisphaeraceae bacterium]|nr:MAG: transglutaminase domain-containing protein [Phycisphaeraceae bacterium]
MRNGLFTQFSIMLALSLLLPAIGAERVFAQGGADEAPVLERIDPQDWTVRAQVFAGSQPLRGRRGIWFGTTFDLERAVIVFPLLKETASSETHVDRIDSELRIDNVVVDDEVTLMGGFPSGQGLGRWDVQDVRGQTLRLIVNIPMTTWSTRYNEERAMQIDWPTGEWPGLPKSALQHQHHVDSNHPVIQRIVDRWTNGAPKSVPPAMLAKQLAGKTLEHMQPVGQGVVPDRLGRFGGLEMQGSAEAAIAKRGSPFDLASLLCAVYRAAGLPARVVIGYDIHQSLGQASGIVAPHPDCGEFRDVPSNIPILHAWVEFFLYDEAAEEGWWIPVDIVRMRQFSSRAQPMNRPWKFFGTHECLNSMAPLSFHYHPPTTVVALGAPGLWGWLPVPEIPSMEQVLMFDAMHTPQRGGQKP